MTCPICHKGIGKHQRTAVREGARVHLTCLDRALREAKAQAREAERDRIRAIDRLLQQSETF